MINQYTTPLGTKGNTEKSFSIKLMHFHLIYISSRKILLPMKKYFNQNFPQLNLKKNTKTMIANSLYIYGALY